MSAAQSPYTEQKENVFQVMSISERVTKMYFALEITIIINIHKNQISSEDL